MGEDELTEQAFDVFLDTIKRLSEYLDHDEVGLDLILIEHTYFTF